MKTKKLFRNLLQAVVVLIAAVIFVGMGFWLIDGRSPQAFIVSHSLKKSTMETYAMRKAEKTDKSTIEIPDGVTFPREVTQYRVGHMQVFESPAQDDSKPVLLYIHGLPPTDLFTGTWEVFYTDIQKTYDKMNAAGVNVHLHAKDKMGHVYPLWPCPEGKEARGDIAEIIALTINTCRRDMLQ